MAKSKAARRFFSASFIARTLAGALLVWLVLTSGAVLLFRFVAPPFTAVMLQQPGPVGEIAYIWVDRNDIAATAARAVMAAEDQRFLAHNGIDFVSLDRAFEEYRDGDGLRGASTITQQVAKNLFLWQGRSYLRKAIEAYFALLIEVLWPKERILEVYLNVAEFGPGVFGVEAAAQEFFGGRAGGLDTSQAALLAAVLPNPQRLRAAQPSAYVRSRQEWIVTQMRLLDARGHYSGLEW